MNYIRRIMISRFELLLLQLLMSYVQNVLCLFIAWNCTWEIYFENII